MCVCVLFLIPHPQTFIPYSDFFLFSHFWPSPRCMAVPGPGIESEPQLRQPWILNPLHWARDRTDISTETSWIINPLHHSSNSSLICIFFCLFRVTPAAYGGSQARAPRSCRPRTQLRSLRAESAAYTTAHCNAASLTH